MGARATIRESLAVEACARCAERCRAVRIQLAREPDMGSLLEALDTLILGSYLAFYLALRNKQDPGKIPWVDHFKARLGAFTA